MSAMPADTDALAGLPMCYTCTDCIDNTEDFMAWNSGILQTRPVAFFDHGVAVANAAGLDLDSDPPGFGLRNFAFDEFKVSARAGDLSSTHFCHKKN
jgi:hypothetical protein